MLLGRAVGIYPTSIDNSNGTRKMAPDDGV